MSYLQTRAERLNVFNVHFKQKRNTLAIYLWPMAAQCARLKKLYAGPRELIEWNRTEMKLHVYACHMSRN